MFRGVEMAHLLLTCGEGIFDANAFPASHQEMTTILEL